MAKELNFSNDMRKKVYAGAHKVAQAVESTLGPAGRTVIVEMGSYPLVTRDGVTVAKNIDLEDPVENIGASLIRNISSTTDTDAGDGTSTSTVIADAIMSEGLKVVDNGVSPIGVRNGIEAAVDSVVEELKRITTEVETEDQIVQVASISANNDKELGKLIAEAISTAGTAGVVTTGESKTTETYMDFVEGMSFPNGYISPYFSTDKDALTVEFEDAYILMCNKVVSNITPLLPILDALAKAGKPLLLIAEDVDGEALSTLIVNSLRGLIKVCAIKAPGFGNSKKDQLEDIAILTGGQVVSDETGVRFESLTVQDLGRARTIKVDKDRTTIIGGFGDADEIQSRINKIQKDIEAEKSDYEKEKLQERLARLAGGVAVIMVGDISETALKEKKFRIEDALNATRAAIEEGVIPGGGSALCHIAETLKTRAHETPVAGVTGYDLGYDIVIKAIQRPLKAIAENAGVSGDVVYNKVAELGDSFGYNALTGEYTDMMKAGIIDPVKVTRLALQNAASVASLVITSSCCITTKKEKNRNIDDMVPINTVY